MFLFWAVLENNFRALTPAPEVTGGPWISTWDPVTLISHGYVDYNMCNNAAKALHRNKETELFHIKSHRKEKQGIWEANPLISYNSLVVFSVWQQESFCMQQGSAEMRAFLLHTHIQRLKRKL